MIHRIRVLTITLAFSYSKCALYILGFGNDICAMFDESLHNTCISYSPEGAKSKVKAVGERAFVYVLESKNLENYRRLQPFQVVSCHICFCQRHPRRVQ